MLNFFGCIKYLLSLISLWFAHCNEWGSLSENVIAAYSQLFDGDQRQDNIFL